MKTATITITYDEEKLAALVNSDIDLVQKGAYNRIVAEKEISWDARIAKLLDTITFNQ